MERQIDKWNRHDLVRRLCHALAIAKRTVERLAQNGYTDPEEPNNSLRPEKVISETAVLLFAASAAAGHDDVREHIDRVARLLIPHARSENILARLCLEPTLALDYSLAHVCLNRLGHKDPDFDGMLRLSLKFQTRTLRERVPHRMMEQEWIATLWSETNPGSPGTISRVARQSALNQGMDLVNGGRDDAYAFTHALMYHTEFGSRPTRLPRPRAVILAEAEAALARCLDDEDYDLGGEVLLAWPFTGASWSAAAAFGFKVLAAVEDKAGFLPSPATRLQRLDKLEGVERSSYLLATAYHTAYVMGLLCAAALQPRRLPPSRIPTATSTPGSAKIILRSLDADGISPHWRDEFDRLADTQRDAISGLLMNMALRRKIKQKDYAAVAKLLQLGCALGLPDSPAASQGVELLERLAMFAQVRRTRCSINGEKPDRSKSAQPGQHQASSRI